MDIRALIKRIYTNRIRTPGAQFWSIRIRSDEVDALLKSLRSHRDTAVSMGKERLWMKARIAELERETDALRFQCADLQRRQNMEPTPQIDVMDDWQRRALESAERRRIMRGRC